MPTERTIDRTALSTATFAEADEQDRAYWWSRTPIERLQHLEALRILNYGAEAVHQPIRRVLEVVERPKH